jgi:hypothetical protein
MESRRMSLILARLRLAAQHILGTENVMDER